MTLAADLTGDLDVFFNSNEFAVEASLKGAAIPIKVIFDDEYREIALSAGSVEGSVPQCLAKSSDVEDAVHGDTLKVGETTYKIIEVQPNGTGITTLMLSKD